MSDDRPAIKALNDALIRQGIDRDAVSILNRIKLDLLHPEPEDICPVCCMTDEQTGSLRTVHIHRSCWSHVLNGGRIHEPQGTDRQEIDVHKASSKMYPQVHEETDGEGGAA